MIPARVGSTRLSLKNLAMIDGKPMIAWAIEAAQASNVFDRVIVNSDSDVFREVATRWDAGFYLRDELLGGSDINSDDVVLDFIEHHDCDVVVWVNSIAPLQRPSDIRDAVNAFIAGQFDTLMTVRPEKVHCRYHDRPVNYSEARKFEKTQELEPVYRFVYSVMAWRTESFKEAMQQDSRAFLVGDVCYFETSALSSFIVKTAEDLLIIDALSRGMRSGPDRVMYYESRGAERP